MKKALVALMIMGLMVLMTQMVSAQAQTQTVNLAVNAISLLSVPAGPVDLTITTGTAGDINLTSVTAGSTYSWTHNSSTAKKITGQLTTALPASGYSLTVTLSPTAGKGSPVANADLTNGSTVDLVTAIARGADALRTITYTFGATADAASLTAGQSANSVVYTLTD